MKKIHSEELGIPKQHIRAHSNEAKDSELADQNPFKEVLLNRLYLLGALNHFPIFK